MKNNIHTLSVLAIALLAWIMIPVQQAQAQAQCTNTPSAAGIVPMVDPGNPVCLNTGFKVDPPVPGTFALGTYGTITITIYDDPGGCGQLIDWSISGTVLIEEFIVKGGASGANIYTYPNPPYYYADQGLHTPLNPSGKYAGLSHYEVCWSPCTPCELTCPANVTIECDESTEPWNTGEAIAIGDYCGEVSYTDETTTVPGACPEEYTITRTFSVNNYCGGGVVSCEQIIEVVDETPPVIYCPPDVYLIANAYCNFSYTGPPASGMDNCAPSVTITYTDGDRIYADDCEDAGYVYSVKRTWKATDDCGNSTTCDQNFFVRDITPPNISCPGPITVECIEDVPDCDPANASASDNCGDVIITCSQGSLVGGVCGGTITETYTATDECGNPASCTRIITVDDNTAPVITCPTAPSPIECPAEPFFPPATAYDNCDAAFVFNYEDEVFEGCGNTKTVVRTWYAYDQCMNFAVPCIQTVVVEDNIPPTIICPPELHISCVQDEPSLDDDLASIIVQDACATDLEPEFLFVYVTAGSCPNKMTIERIFQVSDGCHISTCTRTIIVNDETPPTITCPTVTSPIDCTEEPFFPPASAVDNCEGPVTITSKNVTVWGDCDQEYTVTRTWTATDACGNSASCSRAIQVVDNTPPTITCPTNKTIECPATPVFGTPTAEDDCGDAYVEQVGVDVTGYGDCPVLYTVTRTWRAIDECDNASDPCSQTITVEDNIKPTISCPETFVDCYSQVPTINDDLGVITAEDDCGSVTVSFQAPEIVQNYLCPNKYDIVRTYRASDGCNSVTCVRTIHVFDDTPPVFTFCPPPITVECGAFPPDVPPAAATDNCGIATVTYDDGGSFCDYNGGSFTRTWIATDECSNTATCEQLITCLPCGGCTYTQGYWKTHSFYGPAPYDEDGWMAIGDFDGDGTAESQDEDFYLSGQTWYEVFWTQPNTPPSAKVYYQLAHQYMAAYLNMANGASSTPAVDAAMVWATNFFETYSPTSDIPSSVRKTANDYAGLLDDYNNGDIGPGHCDNELPYYTAEHTQTMLEEAGDLQLRAIPNPFNGEVQFTMDVPYSSRVTLEVFNANGQRVAFVFSAYVEAGQERTVIFDGSNLPEGLYIYRLTTDKEVKSGQLISLE